MTWKLKIWHKVTCGLKPQAKWLINQTQKHYDWPNNSASKELYVYIYVWGFRKQGVPLAEKVWHPIRAKTQLLVTISMTLNIHEGTQQLWITANHCSILAVNNSLWTSSLLYVSGFPVSQGCIDCSAILRLCTVSTYLQSQDIFLSDIINRCC